MTFIDSLNVRNTVAEGLGEDYRRKTSIPQGDPMSMAVVALMMRACIKEMQHYAVEPRLLADDLQIASTRERHLSNFEFAYNRTHLHLEKMGARIAPSKCNTFSSETKSREWLRKHQWRRLGRKVEVVNNCRDLGAHFNATGGEDGWNDADPKDMDYREVDGKAG